MSYQKDGFIDFMYKKGNLQPGGYCNGLDNVEKLFLVDIDAEYNKDECESLYNRIQEVRMNPERIGKNEHTVRQYASNVKRYIEFRQGKKNSGATFTWIPFYEEFANKLLEYKNKRGELLELIKLCFEDLPFEYPFREQGQEDYDDIDPFTVFGSFNKSMKDENRIAILKKYKEAFSVNANVPKDFAGIPVLMNMSAWFFAYKANREEHDIDNLWHLFETALALADGDNSKEKEFIDIYNQVITQRQVKWNITIGLYWVRPNAFLSLDSVSRAYLPEFNPPVGGAISTHELPDGKKYLWDIKELKNTFAGELTMAKSFYELSQKAFEFAESKVKPVAKIDKNVQYWLYSPGERAFNWERDVKTGTMALGWDFLGDFTQYNDEELLAKFQERYNDTSSHKNDKCAILDFVHKMKIGDVIIAKRGTDKIIGKGIVQSEYYYDETLDKYKNLRAVEWTDIGEWEHRPGKAVVKTLTDITTYEGYPEGLCAIIEGADETISVEQTPVESYTKEDFLDDVYISEEKYETCVSRLKHKKNLILQGAPGVGKTFAARRLAWSIMGAKDDERVEFVQFHQSYSYEDFVMGYKPVDTGFNLEKGVFYEFCLKAKNDSTNDYFFIIDEINRGNMSKIFGELLMLIENDYRGTDITLAYDKRPFSVPENLYIIGMMNTADRSLAMIDYALRRRFSFVEMVPGFDSEGFEAYQTAINNSTFNKLIGRVKALNADIENDASLGKGFCIGHSYFCGLEDSCTDSVLKEIVEYDIIPMLEEYWFDDEAKAKNWSNDLSGVFNG